MAGGSGDGVRWATSGNILKYYLYKSTKAVEFYRPIMYLFFLAQGLSFTQIAILQTLYNLTTLLGRYRQATLATALDDVTASSSERPSYL